MPDPVGAARSVAAQLAEHAPAVDRQAAFPAESVAALHRAGLLTAASRPRHGELGCTLDELLRVGVELGRGCGSTAMIWAMHQVQLACLDRHAAGDWAAGRLPAIATAGTLIASVTSEAGVGGDLRRSCAAIVPDGGWVAVEKRAPTVSYGRQAGAFLVTARRGVEAGASDQVAVFAEAGQASLTPTGPAWNPMGMRGTCSPGFEFAAKVPAVQVLPVDFEVIAAATMVPLSHLLWASCWIGIATDAFRRAQAMVRSRSRADEQHEEPRLATAAGKLTQLQSLLYDAAGRYQPIWRDPETLNTSGGPGLTMVLNDVKVLTSTLTVEVAQLALEICGMAGYAEDGPLSVARHLRDLYSARLMIANERLIRTNARLSLLKRV